MPLKLFEFTLITCLLAIFQVNLIGCKCSAYTFDKQIKAAHLIFSGTYTGENETELTFRIMQSWKGSLPLGSEVNINSYPTSCHKGKRFKKGEFYLVYLDEYGIHNCSRTNFLLFNTDVKLLDSKFKSSTIHNPEFLKRYEEKVSGLYTLADRCGEDEFNTLNKWEWEFLKSYLSIDKPQGKDDEINVLFITGPAGKRKSTKQACFKSIKGYLSNESKISCSIHWLTEEEKQESGGYDAILTYWVKYFSKKQRKRTIKKAGKS